VLKMKKLNVLSNDFWKDPELVDLTSEERYFYLYLLTNRQTSQIGIYKISMSKIAFDMDFSLETVEYLIERFAEDYKLIRYNAETREIAIKNWGKYILRLEGEENIDSMVAEFYDVEELSLIDFVIQSLKKQQMYKANPCGNVLREEDFDLNDEDSTDEARELDS
jgi:hypothetical protein